jgi:hypothetical protein
MIKYQETTKTVKVPISVMCDVCKKEFSLENDFLESQEFQHINFVGGFGSVFGDDVEIQCDICQHCLLKLIGDYCRKDVVE